MMKEYHDFKLLLNEMNKYIRDYIADRGLAYYEQGLVENVRIKEPWIHATVLGNYGDYEVQVHMTDFSKSRCGCPYDDYCKHMAAVVFYVTRGYADQPARNEPAVFSRAGASDKAGTSETLEQQPVRQPGNDLQQHLKDMDKDYLLETITRLVEIEPSTEETLRLILTERERNADLHSDKVRQLGLYSSLAYHQKRFPSILKECESLFTKIDTADEDSFDRYGYCDDDYDYITVWDFTKGLEILHRYGQELLKMVTAEHYIPGIMGLLAAVTELEDWSANYEDEYGESDLVDFCSEFEDYLWEALERVRDYQLHDRQAQTFLKELIDWVMLQCKKLDDLPVWTSVLNNCIPDNRYLWHLKERIIKLDRDFLQSARLDDEKHRSILVSWWVELCLSLGLEEEAKQTAGILEGSSQSEASIAYSFIRYYEGLERWPEAIVAMQTILNTGSKINPHDYQRIIRLYEKTGNAQGMKDWYEKWFLSYPNFDLFKQSVALIENDADKEAKIQRWLEHLEQNREFILLISIYLNHLVDIDKAWSVYLKHKVLLRVDEPVILKLFKTMKSDAPAKLIPVYRELALNNISNKNRSAYARAARWMKDLREVCGLSGNEETWTAFHSKIMTEYRRFRALMEEIRAAGIV
ncbi:SWIM zinc finger family protein [Pelotomaculum propionicicum]|uniref:SWIM zinc finger family protein n=1 Tax=Pelotomaculum propionicicum TaxID=258475 RepID=UPI003B7A0576